MTITIHRDVLQGTDAWLKLRRGMLTASEMHLVITPKQLKASANKDTKMHVFELVGQRLVDHVEPGYVSEAMQRGRDDEDIARSEYRDNHAWTESVGFVTNDDHGFMLGGSPDDLVGDDGVIEIKCPDKKRHVACVVNDEIPEEHHLQIQVILLVTGRKWCDFISYHNGMHLFVKRMHADPEMQAAIVEAARAFCAKVDETVAKYHATIAANPLRMTPTAYRERTINGLDFIDSSTGAQP